MKKILLPLIAIFLSNSNLIAQNKEYNKWSFELNGGATQPLYNWTEGYSTSLGFLHLDAGFRFMMNDKFGLKASVAHENIKNGKDSEHFKTNIQRYSVEGVVNVGRILSFEDWTKTIGLLVHAGASYTTLKYDNFPNRKDDAIAVIFGITPQVKLSNRIALTFDFTALNNFGQGYTWDGADRPNNEIQAGGTVVVDGESGIVDITVPDPSAKFLKHFNPIINTTVGLTFYLGNKPSHADWHFSDSKTNKIKELEDRIQLIENYLIDSDGDGILDYLDLEPNTPSGNMVNIKGVSIDLNKNGIPDSYEAYFIEYTKPTEDETQLVDSDKARELINDGYVAMYFDFDKSEPKNIDAAHFVLTYLKRNPESNVEINGYADSVGNTEYNLNLSDERAKNVSKILEDAGIDKSRIKIVGQGIDTSLNGNSKVASSFARRVTFSVK